MDTHVANLIDHAETACARLTRIWERCRHQPSRHSVCTCAECLKDRAALRGLLDAIDALPKEED